MITLVSRWRALFPFLLLCWLVKKSTILAKTEKTGTKYKSFLSLWSYFHCALRSGKSVWSLHQRRPAGAFFCGQCFVSPGIQQVCSFFSQNLMLVLQIPPFSQIPRKRWTWLHPMRDPSKAVILEGKVEKQWFSIIGTKAKQRHGGKTKNIWFNREKIFCLIFF